MKVLELFSGIGGMRSALIESAETFTMTDSYEINPSALMVYKYNYPEASQIKEKNIMGLTVAAFEDMEPDLLTMSPPCQPFTRQGLKKDVTDARCSPLLHILSIMEAASVLPKMIFLENVAGFETSQAHSMLIEILEAKKFVYQEFLISPSQLGIPNSRLRYYLLAKLHEAQNFHFPVSSKIHTTIPVCLCIGSEATAPVNGGVARQICPLCSYPVVPRVSEAVKKMFKNILSDQEDVRPIKVIKLPLQYFIEDIQDVEQYLVKEKELIKYCTIFDIVTSSSLNSCCFTKGYGRYVQGTGSVILHNTAADVHEVYRQLGSLSNEDSRYTELLSALQLRYFTPKEMLRLMCFPNSFNIPPSVSNKQAYRAIGNSVNVFVVTILMLLLFD